MITKFSFGGAVAGWNTYENVAGVSTGIIIADLLDDAGVATGITLTNNVAHSFNSGDRASGEFHNFPEAVWDSVGFKSGEGMSYTLSGLTTYNGQSYTLKTAHFSNSVRDNDVTVDGTTLQYNSVAGDPPAPLEFTGTISGDTLTIDIALVSGTTTTYFTGFTLDITASNSAPVVNDQTFSVADSASNGTVIGTVVATDSDGTVDSYAISGTQLSINSTTGQITLADNAGIVAGTPITATVTVTDNSGDTDTATVTVNVTNSGLSFSCYDADSSNAAITSETLSHVRVLDPADLSEVATATSIATSSTGSAEIDTDSVTIGTDYLVIARRSNGDVCEPFLVTASDLAAS